jgi:hypothetical protein
MVQPCSSGRKGEKRRKRRGDTVIVVHTCNPNNLGGRNGDQEDCGSRNPNNLGGRNGDQEDCGSRPAKVKISRDPISTNCWSWRYIPVIPATQEA